MNKSMITSTPVDTTTDGIVQTKSLVVYYSYTGNTKTIAKLIQQKINSDIFEITIDYKYPEEYRPMTEQAKEELKNNFLPKLTSKIDNIDQYDVIFLGSPNWWGTVTPAVRSFLANYNLNSKKIVPFITHGGGGVQNTIKDIKELCKDCIVEENGWVSYENNTNKFDEWINKMVSVD